MSDIGNIIEREGRMFHSESINEIAAALAKAQGEVEGATKDSANPAFKSKYADLASVYHACRTALASNAIAVVQLPGSVTAEGLELTTILTHSSGQWFRTTSVIPMGKRDAHGYGSALTYGRRYCLSAMVGVAQEDDDGNAASQGAPAKPEAPVELIGADGGTALAALAEEAGLPIETILTGYKVASLAELTTAQGNASRKRLEKLIADKAAPSNDEQSEQVAA